MDNATSNETSQDQLDWILGELNAATSRVPTSAILAARRHKELVIPVLIREMQRSTHALRQKEQYVYNGAFFALFLLAEFRAADALPAIIDAISLPDDGPFKLFGDAIHDVLPRVLVSLGQDRTEEICSALFRNPVLNQYVRWSAAKTIVYLAMAGLRPRSEIVGRCQQLLREAIEKKDEGSVTALVISMIDLNPWEAANEVTEAFKTGLVDEWTIDWDSAKEHLRDEPMERTYEYSDPPVIEDTIKEIESWASFQEPESRGPLTAKSNMPRSAARPTVPFPKPAGRAIQRVGRNDPCPCGSGKKFKRCCGGRK